MITKFKIFEEDGIKTFERINQPKKYLLVKSLLDDDLFFVLELLDNDHKTTTTKKLYRYDKQEDKLVRKRHQTYSIGDKDIFDECVIYQSDILQEDLDVIPTLKEIDKYNL